MGRQQRFDVPMRFISFNEFIQKAEGSNRRKNYYPARLYKRDVQDSIIWCIKSRKLKRVKRPVIITFVWYEGKRGKQKRRDKDNVSYRKKFILDALQERNILPNDNDKWIQGLSDYFIYDEGQKVTVIINEVDEVTYKESEE